MLRPISDHSGIAGLLVHSNVHSSPARTGDAKEYSSRIAAGRRCASGAATSWAARRRHQSVITSPPLLFEALTLDAITIIAGLHHHIAAPGVTRASVLAASPARSSIACMSDRTNSA
jgi:hypothetical protein